MLDVDLSTLAEVLEQERFDFFEQRRAIRADLLASILRIEVHDGVLAMKIQLTDAGNA